MLGTLNNKLKLNFLVKKLYQIGERVVWDLFSTLLPSLILGGSWDSLLGLLVSKFKRGGVNWSYKIFAKHKLVYSISEEKEQIDFKRNRLILQNTLTQSELIQIRIEIKQWKITEVDWLIFNSLKNTVYTKRSLKFIQHKTSKRMNLYQRFNEENCSSLSQLKNTYSKCFVYV